MKRTIARLDSACQEALQQSIDDVERLTHPGRKYIFALQRYRKLSEELTQIMLRAFNYNEVGKIQKDAIDEVINRYLDTYRRRYL